MTLLEECIKHLDKFSQVYSKDVSSRLFDEFQNDFPFTSFGRIDWDKIKKKQTVSNLKSVFNEFDTEDCFIFWDEESLPVIKSEVRQVIKFLDDVLAVSFDTWILSSSHTRVVEFYHEGQITIGYR